MKPRFLALMLFVSLASLCLISCQTKSDPNLLSTAGVDTAQVPAWSQDDMEFFLHGSMSTEVVPENVLRTFMEVYPDLFPRKDLSHLGLIPDPAFGWPIGFSRKDVRHLGGLSSIGINCASCHVGDVIGPGGKRVRVLGMTSHFDPEAFFGAVTIATFRTANTTNMQRFVAALLKVNDPASGTKEQKQLALEWQSHEKDIEAAISADPTGAKGLATNTLHLITEDEVELNSKTLDNGVNLAALAHSYLKLFHNMRAALHILDQPPAEPPPASGPGRNDAFGILSLTLFGVPQNYAPAKFGLVWNLDKRYWVHWDGNTRSPLARNLIASLGLGAPLTGRHGILDLMTVKRQTDLSEYIRSPRYPFPIDADLARRGATHYEAKCASCHDGPEGDTRLHSPAEIGTEPQRAMLFTQVKADRFNRFFAELETPGYQPPSQPGVRTTQKYWAPTLSGVWARSPYLHNGSVRTMAELLTPSTERSKSFHRGSKMYDTDHMGYTDSGPYLLDTATPGNSGGGHEYGAELSAEQKRQLIEYLKTL